MDPNRYISIREFCGYHQLEKDFLHALREYGLLEIVVVSDQEFIERERIRELEKMIRLHYDLHINIEGIDVVTNLLDKVSELQDEVRLLQNRLRRYE